MKKNNKKDKSINKNNSKKFYKSTIFIIILHLLVISYIFIASIFDSRGKHIIIAAVVIITLLCVKIYQLINKEINKKTEETKVMEEQFKFLQILLDTIPIPIFYKDVKGVYQKCNKYFEDFLGLKKEDIIGKTVYDLFSKEDADKYAQMDNELFKDETQKVREFTVANVNGKKVEFIFNKNIYFNSQEDAIGVVSTLTDITERKQMERRLKKSEQKYRSLVENISDIIFTIDMNGVFTYISPVIQKLFKYKEEEIIGKHFSKFVFEDDLQGLSQSFERSLKGKDEPYEFRAIDKDGSIRYVSSSSQLAFEGEEIVGLTGVFSDITERKKAKVDKRESEKRLEDIINFLPDATFVIDSEGKVLAWNRAIEEMTGVKAEDILGKGNYEYSMPFYGERRPILIDLILKDDKEIEEKYWFLKKEKKLLVAETATQLLGMEGRFSWGKATPLYNSEGDIVGAIEAIRDITDKKNSEQEMQKEKEKAEAANHAKSTFLANMSHEIRTPMNGIIGMTELLATTQINEVQRDYLEMIKVSADSLMNIINDILDFSKIEAGKVVLEENELNFIDIIEKIVEIFSLSAHKKGLELICDIHSDVPTKVIGDTGRLRQIMVNLIGNAIKFTEVGEVYICIEKTSQTEDGKTKMRFSVKDTGIGIEKDKIDCLFKSFSQIDNAYTKKYAGTGLGLVISKRLIEMMGGIIGVETKKDEGSTFYFEIPFKIQEGKEESREVTEHKQIEKLNVLIIDDNSTNRILLGQEIKELGASVMLAEDEEEAVKILKENDAAQNPIKLILLDSCMGEINGFDLAARINNELKYKGHIVMMLTAQNLWDDVEKCRKIENSTYILKPVKRLEIYNIIKRTIENQIVIYRDERGNASADKHNRVLYQDTEQKPRILVIEDNAINLKLAVVLLEKKNYKAVGVINGKEGLKELEANPYDLILMDIQMPEMDGFEATTAIREKEKESGRHIPIVAMTAYALKEDREKCLELGMDDYISKPIKSAELYTVIERLLTDKENSKEDIPQDFFEALQAIDGDKTLIKELARDFINIYPKQLREIREGIENNEILKVQKLLHKLKGMIGTFGLKDVYNLVDRLESMKKEGEETELVLENIEHKLERFKTFFISFDKKEDK